MKKILRFALLIGGLACSLVAPNAHSIVGQPGTLDTTWNSTGKVITPIGTGNDVGAAMSLQPDGKVLLAGYCFNAAKVNFCAARYLPSGAIDTSWNGTGIVNTPIGSANDVGRAMTLQPDGKVLVAGGCLVGSSNDFCVARYLSNGTLDPTWNGNGKVITPIGSANDVANAVAMQPDGKVLVAGYCSNGANDDFCVARYLQDGTLDPTWNSNGKVITPVGGSNDVANAIALQPDGKVLLVGTCFNGTNDDFCAVRYLANGTLDPTWGGRGTVTISFGSGDDHANAVALQPDGKVLIAGYCWNGTDNEPCAARLAPDGSLDGTWNVTGKTIAAVGSGDDRATAVAGQPDGKVLLTGSCSNGANSDFCALRFMPNGTLDTAWNGTGTVITPIGGGTDAASAVALQPDGKVLLGGYCFNGSNNDFCIARYDSGPFGYRNCSLDLDGDGSFLATTDVLIYARVALGLAGNAVVNGINFPPTATRNTWPLIRDYLVTQCGMSLVQ